MKNSVKLSCLAVVVSTVWSGCTADKKPSQAAAPPAAEPPGADMDRGLAGTKWSLEEIGGKPVMADSRASLDFPTNPGVAGNGSCNRFTGSVEITGSTLKFGPLAATRMMCGPDSTRQESEYLKALADVDRYEIRNRLMLYLYMKNSDQPLKFHAVL